MDTKYVKLLFVLLLFLTLLTIPFSEETKTTLSPDTVESFFENEEIQGAKNAIKTYPKDTFIFDMPTLSVKDKNSYAKDFHNEFEGVVKAMLELRRQGIISKDELLAVHKHISNFAIGANLEIPHSDKDLVDYLYDNNLITESQYEKLLDLLDD